MQIIGPGALLTFTNRNLVQIVGSGANMLYSVAEVLVIKVANACPWGWTLQGRV